MMAHGNTRRMVFLVWAVANIALVLLIGAELGWGTKLIPPTPAPAVLPSAPVKIVLPPDYRLPALDKAFAGTVERSLFVPTRRKAPPPPPPPPPSMQKGQFMLLGTTITDEFSIAIVKEISSGKVRQVYKGFTINGLQLDVVEPDRIVFSQYDDQEVIRLKIQPSPKPAPATQPQAEQPARQAVPTPQNRAEPASGAAKAPVASERRAGRAGRGGANPLPPPPTMPLTIEERKKDPMLKDFYK